MEEIIDEKVKINNEYEKLNLAYQSNLKEQHDLLVLCSSYEDQLRQCRTLVQSAGLTVKQKEFYLKIITITFFQVPNFLLEIDNAE